MWTLFNRNEERRYTILVAFSTRGGTTQTTELDIVAANAIEAAVKTVDQIRPNKLYSLIVEEKYPVNVGSRELLEYRFERQ